MRDLLCHLIIDAQDVLITLVTPTDAEPTRNEVTYWDVAQTPPKGDEPLDALTRRPPPPPVPVPGGWNGGWEPNGGPCEFKNLCIEG